MVAAAGVMRHRRPRSLAPNIGGLALFLLHRLAGALCALALVATSASPTLADQTPLGRLTPSSRGSRQESEQRALPPVVTAAPEPAPAPPPPPPSIGDRIVGIAFGAVGSPYLFGGSSPVTGFDCSGLVHWVLEQLGVDIARSAAAQYGYGEPVAPPDMRPGDLVFFANTYMPGLSHVGIYVGDGQFVDAGTERTGVRRASLGDPYWAARFVGARRIR
jgi:cell wall-associated NlpC family hydrolase